MKIESKRNFGLATSSGAEAQPCLHYSSQGTQLKGSLRNLLANGQVPIAHDPRGAWQIKNNPA